MKKLINILSAIALILGLNACQSTELDQTLIQETFVKVTLHAGDVTRTSMAPNGDVLWSANDAIAVAATSGNIYKFVLTSGEGTTSATFEGMVRPSDVEHLTNASYPYVDNLSIVEGVITGFAIPLTQEYVAGTFADNVNPMVGTVSEGAVTFANTAAIAKVTLYSGLPVTKAELGSYKMVFNDLDASEGVDLIFVVEPANYSSGIALKVNDVTVNAFAGKNAEAGKRFDFGTYCTNMCKIDDTVYNTLAEAVAAAPAGAETTITMLGNEVIFGNDGVTIPAGKNIVLDLNGKTVKNEVKTSAGSQVINNKGTLKVTGNGTLTNSCAEGLAGEWPDYNYVTNVISNSGALVIDGATIRNEAAGSICYCVDNYAGGSLTINETDPAEPTLLYNFYTYAVRMFCGSTTADNAVTVNGGTINGYGSLWMQNTNSNANKGTLTITGGNFKTTEKAVVNGTTPLLEADSCIYLQTNSNNMTVSISGGTFDVPLWMKFGETAETTPDYSISGGTFNGWMYASGNVKFMTGGTYVDNEITDWICDGYILEDNGDDTYTIVEQPYVAQIGETMYATLPEAFAAVNDNETITILVSGNYDFPASVTKSGVTVAAATGVTATFTHTTAGNICGLGQGITFENLTFEFGTVNYHGFQHAGEINMVGCTINGKFFSYGDMNFTNCTFNAPAGPDYSMWCYGGDLYYKNCTFNGTGKYLNVFNEGSAAPSNITVDGCTFVNTAAAKKAPVLIKAKCNATDLKYIVTIKGENTLTGNFPTGLYESDVTAIAENGIWAVEDDGTPSGTIKVYEETVLVYPTYVARIGEDEYLTLADAIAAAPNGVQTTITMLADESIEGNAGVTIANGKDIVLDLNGKTVSNLVNANGSSQVITNRGTLTIKDTAGNGLLTNAVAEGTEAGDWWATPQYNYATNVITNCGTLNIESGEILQTAAGSICYAIDNNSTSADAIVNISGGLVTTTGSTAMRMYCNSTTNENALNMTAGTIEGSNTAFWVQLPGSSAQAKKASVNISGGAVKGTGADGYAWYDYSFGDIFDAVTYTITGGQFTGYLYSYGVAGFVKGGIFSKNPSSWVASGYFVSENTDDATKAAYPYTVIPCTNLTGTTTSLGGWL